MSKIEELTNEASAMRKDISSIAEQGGRTPLGELIQQYCPNGVKYKTIKETYTRIVMETILKSSRSIFTVQYLRMLTGCEDSSKLTKSLHYYAKAGKIGDGLCCVVCKTC